MGIGKNAVPVPQGGARNQSALARKSFFKQYQLYLMLLLPVAYLLIFHYGPMAGLVISFKDYQAGKGIFGSPWVGLKHFTRFFQSHQFLQVVSNTLKLSMYSLLANFPIPILLAIGINSCVGSRYKKVVQMATYAPYFLSVTIVVSMINQFFAEKTGVVNMALSFFTGERVSFLTQSQLFPHFYVWSGVWQNLGFSSIIYIATLAGVDPTLHEAARVDGANKFQRTFHIDLPGILPTATILLILNIGQLMTVGFEKVYLMQNSTNISQSQVISTFIYQQSIGSEIPNFSYSTAVGLFNSLINFTLLLGANKLANKLNDGGLF